MREKKAGEMRKKTSPLKTNKEKCDVKRNICATPKSQKFTIGVWGFYEEVFKSDWIFFTPNSALGDNILKPMNDFYRFALQNNIEVHSLDTIQVFDQVDAFLFWDFPHVDKFLVRKAMTSEKPCYLVIAESPIIRPENWLDKNQKYFTKIFTYHNDIIDNKKYFKLNYVTDIPSTIDMDIKNRKKLCTLIAGNKIVNHELSLYPSRIEAIRWFEKYHPEEFDLFGIGWDKNEYPSYRGQIDSKFELLKEYKFSICYENIRDINGYITEKIFDSLKSGCVPIYWGAKNVTDYIPKDCFIDKRKFFNYRSLYNFMKEMSDEDYLHYLDNIENFFNSEKVSPFTIETFTKTILEQVTGNEIDVHQSQTGLSKLKENLEVENKYEFNSSNVKTNNDPLVSITMVHYNRFDCLQECINSIRRNTSKPYELIIADNGSTDGVSVDYLRSLSDITLIEIPANGRPDKASLMVLSLAKGKYIASISDDIIFTPNWLELCLNHIERNPKIGSIGPRTNFVSGPQLIPNVPYKNIQELDDFSQKWTQNYFGGSSLSTRLVGFFTFYRRELLTKIGGTDPRFIFGFNDDDFTLRTIIAGYNAIIAHDILIHHTGGPQMRGNSEYNKKILQSWDVFKRKWGLPKGLEVKHCHQYDIDKLLKQGFDPKKHFIPLPDRAEVEEFIYKSDEKILNNTDKQISITQLLEQGEKLFEEQNFEDSKKIFQTILIVDPNHFKARNDLACVLWQSNQLEDAAGEFRKAMEIAPNDRDITWNSGQFLSSIGFVDEAIDIYQGFLSRFPEDKEIENSVKQWEKITEKDLMTV